MFTSAGMLPGISAHSVKSLLLNLYRAVESVAELYWKSRAQRIKVLGGIKALHIEEIYSKSLSAPFRSVFCQAWLASRLTGCIARHKVKPFAVIKLGLEVFLLLTYFY